MKLITIFTFLLIISLQSLAQTNSDSLFYTKKIKRFKAMKRIGIGLTITGSILLTGFSTFAFSDDPKEENFSEIAFISGAAFLGSGITFVVIGESKVPKYKKKLENISVKVNINPRASGLTLTYYF